MPSPNGFRSYDQMAEFFGQIVPGMTRAQVLPNLGFDTRTVPAGRRLGRLHSWSPEITLLVMNGRVTDKVLS